MYMLHLIVILYTCEFFSTGEFTMQGCKRIFDPCCPWILMNWVMYSTSKVLTGQYAVQIFLCDWYWMVWTDVRSAHMLKSLPVCDNFLLVEGKYWDTWAWRPTRLKSPLSSGAFWCTGAIYFLCFAQLPGIKLKLKYKMSCTCFFACECVFFWYSCKIRHVWQLLA